MMLSQVTAQTVYKGTKFKLKHINSQQWFVLRLIKLRVIT